MYQVHTKYSICITDLSNTTTISIVTTAAMTSSNTTITTAAVTPSDPRKVVVYIRILWTLSQHQHSWPIASKAAIDVDMHGLLSSQSCYPAILC